MLTIVFNRCGAKFTVKIKLNTKKTRRTDMLIDDYPCILTFNNRHNHSLESSDVLEQLKILKSTKELFNQYFEAGYSAAEAIRYQSMKLLGSEDYKAMSSSRTNPKNKFVYHLWDVWRRNTCGPLVGEKMLDAMKEIAPNSVRIKELGSKFICAVVTPFMRRVHTTMVQSHEIVFADSTSHLGMYNLRALFVK